MARKVATIKITAEGRDKGKQFEITEMSAASSEDWAMRAISVAGRSGIDIPAALLNGGMAGFAVLGMQAFMQAPHEQKKPLLDEMLTCVKYQPEDVRMAARALVESDIEEVSTLLKLREEVMQLHLGFFKPAVQLIRTVIDKMMAGSSITPTSPEPSEP